MAERDKKNPSTAGKGVLSLLPTPAESQQIASWLQLPPRQAEIIALLLQGKMDKQIALLLGLSRHTVRGYMRRIFARQGVTSRMEFILHLLANCLRSGGRICPSGGE